MTGLAKARPLHAVFDKLLSGPAVLGVPCVRVRSSALI